MGLVIDGDETGRLSRLFSTHPPMEDRIDRLLDRADRSAGPTGIRTGRPGST